MDLASVDISQRMRAAAHRFGLTAFWRWWVAELAPLAPPALSTAVARRRLRPVLAFETDSIVVWNPVLREGRMQFAEAARVPRSGDAAAARDAGRAAIEALPSAPYGAAARRVVVALPRGEVLRKQFTLPAAVERDLKQTLAYDLDRHTPFKPDELYFDATVVARDPGKKEIRVDWAAARRSVVDQVVKQAESFGASVAAVTPEVIDAQGPATRRSTKLDLLAAAPRDDRSMWRRWQLWAPLALIVLFVLVAIALPLWQKRAYTLALLRVTSEARTQAEVSSALRTQLEQQAADYNFALGKKYAYPNAAQIIDDVTKLMPDDTWLTQFEVKSASKGKDPYREMLLKGESANAGRLVTLLEDSQEFVDAAPRSPTMKIQPGPGEIFDFAARVKPLAAPARIEIASAAAASPPAPAGAESGATPAPATSAPAAPGAAASALGAAGMDGSAASGGTPSPAEAAVAPAASASLPATSATASKESAAPAARPALPAATPPPSDDPANAKFGPPAPTPGSPPPRRAAQTGEPM